MAKLNIEITANASAFRNYAEKIGYFEQIIDENDNLVPNPESAQDFLGRRVKEIIASSLSEYQKRDIRATKDQETRDAELAAEQTIKDVINVAFSA